MAPPSRSRAKVYLPDCSVFVEPSECLPQRRYFFCSAYRHGQRLPSSCSSHVRQPSPWCLSTNVSSGHQLRGDRDDGYTPRPRHRGADSEPLTWEISNELRTHRRYPVLALADRPSTVRLPCDRNIFYRPRTSGASAWAMAVVVSAGVRRHALFHASGPRRTRPRSTSLQQERRR